jgi:ubiquinone/menaquinone biosynthesis C-methylase UbiE
VATLSGTGAAIGGWTDHSWTGAGIGAGVGGGSVHSITRSRCGSGLFSRPLAKAVAAGGKVYAVDIQQDLLDYLDKRDREENIRNIQTVLGEFDAPKLPVRNIDLAFINDVLHHIENRAAYLKALGGYIKPNGRIAIIEMNKDDPHTPHKKQPEFLVAREEILKWMSDAGFTLVRFLRVADDPGGRCADRRHT